METVVGWRLHENHCDYIQCMKMERGWQEMILNGKL